MGTIARVASSMYAKIIVGAVCGFLAIVGGLYAGYAWVQPAVSGESRSFKVEPESYLTFEPGDLFPYEDYVGPDGTSGNFEQLLKNHETVILCVSLDCEPCFTLLKFWQTYMQDRLRPGVRTVYMLPRRVDGIPTEYAGLFDGGTVIFHDLQYWSSTYHHVFWPTLIGVDSDGFVSHVQFGFANSLDQELVRRFLK